MTRLLLLVSVVAATAAAVLLWASSRDLREPWVWLPVPTPDPEDFESVPVDPYLVRNVEPVPMDDWPELPAYPRPIGGM